MLPCKWAWRPIYLEWKPVAQVDGIRCLPAVALTSSFHSTGGESRSEHTIVWVDSLTRDLVRREDTGWTAAATAQGPRRMKFLYARLPVGRVMLLRRWKAANRFQQIDGVVLWSIILSSSSQTRCCSKIRSSFKLAFLWQKHLISRLSNAGPNELCIYYIGLLWIWYGLQCKKNAWAQFCVMSMQILM